LIFLNQWHLFAASPFGVEVVVEDVSFDDLAEPIIHAADDGGEEVEFLD
jgi:hypothetical protein